MNTPIANATDIAKEVTTTLDRLGIGEPATITSPCCGHAVAPGSVSATPGEPYLAVDQFTVPEERLLVSLCVGCAAVIADNRDIIKRSDLLDLVPVSEFHLADRHPVKAVAQEDLPEVEQVEAVAARMQSLAAALRLEADWAEATSAYNFRREVGSNMVRDLLVRMVGQASHYIHIVTYTPLCDDISAAIVAAAARGVTVRVVYDKAQTGGLPLGELPQDTDLSTLELRATPPLPDRMVRNADLYETVQHAKLLIIDGVLGVRGSMNFTWSGTLRSPWGEDPVLLTDPASVQELNNTRFVDNWFRAELAENEREVVYGTCEALLGGDRYVDPMLYLSLAEAQAVYQYFVNHVRATLTLGTSSPLLLVPVRERDGGSPPHLRAV